MNENHQDKSILRIGIDLGTTNSEIAINNETQIDIIENNVGDLYTPTVFGISKSGDSVVGKTAFESLYKNAKKNDVNNYKAEVKRMMGTADSIYIERNDTNYLPEEISSEILKSLKNDALRRYPDISTLGAVITVPAYFSTQQKEATKRAGQLAGFKHVSLLQEPIAAAISYGFNSTQNDTWLVYDLGGGTLDVALVNAHDGILTVIEHGGDNFCGGKDIDNIIIEEVIKPKLLKKYKFTNLNRKNEKYFVEYNRMKGIAEKAKIKLSTSNEVEIDLSDLYMIDEDGKEVDDYFKFTRKEFDKLIADFVDKTIVVTKEVIVKSNINRTAISKVILVGASTLIPYIQYKIGKEIGVNVDTSQNPFTAIARGAAIFALGQRVPQDIIKEHREDEFDEEVELQLNFDAMTSEKDQMITGKVLSENSDNYRIKISSDSGFYNSDMLKVNNGTFFTYLSLEEGKTNKFWIYLLDEQGNNINIFPNSITITQGLSIAGTPIPHAFGVIYSVQDINSDTGWSEACEVYFERSSILPLKETREFKTISEIKRGSESILPIKFYEGDSLDPKYVNEVTRIGIDGSKLPIDLPKGSDVEITIEIDEAGEAFVEVYLPLADISLDARVDKFIKNIKEDEIIQEIYTLENELKALENKLDSDDKNNLHSSLEDIRRTLDINNDSDSKQKAEKEIKELKQNLEALKSQSEFDRVSDKYDEQLNETKDKVSEVKDETARNELDSSIQKIEEEAISYKDDKNTKLLGRLIDQLSIIERQAELENPGFWIGLLMYIESNKSMLMDQQQGSYHIDEAKKAVIDDDFEALKSHVQKLIQLVSRESSIGTPIDITGITK